MQKSKDGFTLIELSIVLVIVGLIVGGILVGRDLISASAVRGQISQIEKYQQAVNTFRLKYDFLPGDIPNPEATNFGFATRGQYTGQGDGNGLLEGVVDNTGSPSLGGVYLLGELSMLWVDLSVAKLINGNFNTATPSTFTGVAVSGTNLTKYFPEAKIGQGNFIYVWNFKSSTQVNYFAISSITNINGSGQLTTDPALAVKQAHAIDSKMDDGMPQKGRVVATYIHNFSYNVGAAGGGTTGAAGTAATAGSSVTCYDNNNVNTATQQYSISQNNGAGMNCALSFQFQ